MKILYFTDRKDPSPTSFNDEDELVLLIPDKADSQPEGFRTMTYPDLRSTKVRNGLMHQLDDIITAQSSGFQRFLIDSMRYELLLKSEIFLYIRLDLYESYITSKEFDRIIVDLEHPAMSAHAAQIFDGIDEIVVWGKQKLSKYRYMRKFISEDIAKRRRSRRQMISGKRGVKPGTIFFVDAFYKNYRFFDKAIEHLRDENRPFLLLYPEGEKKLEGNPDRHMLANFFNKSLRIRTFFKLLRFRLQSFFRKPGDKVQFLLNLINLRHNAFLFEVMLCTNRNAVKHLTRSIDLFVTTSIANSFVRAFMLALEPSKRRVLIQHGLMNCNIFENHFVTSELILWGNGFRDEMLANGVNAKINISGTPLTSFNDVQPGDGQVRTICYFPATTQGSSLSSMDSIRIANDLQKCASSFSDSEWLCKYKNDTDREALKMHMPGLKDESDFSKALNDSDLIIVTTSTVGIEAAANQKPLIVYNPEAFDPLMVKYLLKYEAAYFANSPEELMTFVEKILSGEIPSISQNQKRLQEDMFTYGQPESNKRIIDLLFKKEMIQAKALA